MEESTMTKRVLVEAMHSFLELPNIKAVLV